MNPKTVENLTWVLIYGGLLLLSLGAFVRERSAAIGTTLLVLGMAAAVAGSVLIWVRSRMKTPGPNAGTNAARKTAPNTAPNTASNTAPNTAKDPR